MKSVLLHNVEISGIVQKGKGEAGALFGIKTANIQGELSPGTYLGKTEVNSVPYDAVLYAGAEPKKIEAHLFGFEGDLLGRNLTLMITKKIAEHVPFVSIDQMREKIQDDLKKAKEYLCLPE